MTETNAPTDVSVGSRNEEPRTKAGQAMESWLREPEDYEWGRKVTAAILAIEAEAGELDVARLREAIRATRDADPLGWLDFGDEVDKIADEYACLSDRPGEQGTD